MKIPAKITYGQNEICQRTGDYNGRALAHRLKREQSALSLSLMPASRDVSGVLATVSSPKNFT